MVKATDPAANVLGPSDFDWPVYVNSLVKGDRTLSNCLHSIRIYAQFPQPRRQSFSFLQLSLFCLN
ncbi:hypothetical protein E5S67_02398 [Microcoleus sp. IPMA8]|uniref:Uncharacterized protein n=1 Tax=Microcoleus asticus IPMA8 TaxID=2563858 RepID=A0ABX2CZ02_9CYAN|nr:hypothetical protein [Microcoleus asticus IPMA8]